MALSPLDGDGLPSWLLATSSGRKNIKESFRDKSTAWNPHEINYLQYLLKLPLKWEEKVKKFHGRFGDFRTYKSITTQARLLRRAARAQADKGIELSVPQETLKDVPSQPQILTLPPFIQDAFTAQQAFPKQDTSKTSRRGKGQARTESAARTYLQDRSDDKREYLRSVFNNNCRSWDEVTTRMKDRFDPIVSRQVFQEIAKQENIKATGFVTCKDKDWSNEEHALLESLLQTKTKWKEVYDELETAYPKGRDMPSVKQYAKTHSLDVSKVTAPPRWTPREDKLLQKFLDSGVPRPEYTERFWAQVGPGRTKGSIIERTQKLGLLANKSWTKEELQKVRDNRHLKLEDFVAQFWNTFGDEQRTYKTIKERRQLDINM